MYIINSYSQYYTERLLLYYWPSHSVVLLLEEVTRIKNSHADATIKNEILKYRMCVHMCGGIGKHDTIHVFVLNSHKVKIVQQRNNIVFFLFVEVLTKANTACLEGQGCKLEFRFFN